MQGDVEGTGMGVLVGDEPLISIVTPVFDPDRNAFKSCVRSVLRQTGKSWEWCLVDDCSSDAWVWKYLQKLAKKYPNLKVQRRSENGGISRATNDAISLARGEYVAFLDHDDLLHRDAIEVVKDRIDQDPTIDVMYSDEQVVEMNGVMRHVFHKPDWSPERFLCQNYCCHFSVVRRSLVQRVGGLRPDFDGAQDHDLLLRVTELSSNIVHIRKNLYSWRAAPTSTASSPNAKPHAYLAMRKAVEEACSRRGIDASLVSVDGMFFRVRRRLREHPLVSVIIPTRGKVDTIWGQSLPLIENFLRSSMIRSTYSSIEYVVVFDSGMDESLLRRIRDLPLRIQLVEYSEAFDFSRKCNLGAVHSSGERLLFVNDDIEVATPEWIERLIGFLEDPSIGAVGPLLLFENGLIQSAGHLNAEHGPGNFARDSSPGSWLGGGRALQLNREVSGLSGACLVIRRDTFYEMGGFSEVFPVNFNDVDLGLKLLRAGYRLIWTPDARLFHFEGRSRGGGYEEEELETLRYYWKSSFDFGSKDPYLPVI
jgi:glycosyltransferase involved in cell wall biosynthesis